MNHFKLSDYFTIERRYNRSINLERDLDNLDTLNGYVLTNKYYDIFIRILESLRDKDKNNCWTLTGVYGTGKSAFCHYLASLLTNKNNKNYQSSIKIINNFLSTNFSLDDSQKIINKLPKKGLFRAVAVAQREPIINTIIRALNNGLTNFDSKNKLEFQNKLNILNKEINQGKVIKNNEIINFIKIIISQEKTDVIFIIDELGKNLENAVYNQGAEDLYLLQQLAELETIDNHRVYVLGILHQAFTEYGQRLTKIQRNEWAKIQGRFEDIPFTESVSEMMRLMAEAINHPADEEINKKITDYSQQWFTSINKALSVEKIDQSILQNVYPLHPLTALVLPTLCMRYAQNDRTLFTFITSDEPFSFKNFLAETNIDVDNLPTLKLDRVYDYFIESAGMGLTSRPNLQRWIEIHDLIADSKSLDDDSLRVLKVIGILNLVTITGTTKATRQLVTLALCNSPQKEEINYWQEKIDNLLKAGIITYRRQIDELRIWQGSDFNVDQELESYQESESLVKLLSELRPLKPIVAQRHSYRIGTLRYFERHYLDSSSSLDRLKCDSDTADGYLGYWLTEDIPSSFPTFTVDGLPVIIIIPNNLQILRLRVREFSALNWLDKTAKELQADGVARKEVRYRLAEAEKYLDDTLASVFDVSEENNRCWIEGKLVNLSSVSQLNSKLSRICDEIYSKSPILWNELINCRNLTAQGMMARRILITAMINNCHIPKLGLTGYGPEVTMYYSLLQETGIHQEKDGEWGLYPPVNEDNPNIIEVWTAIKSFCISATEKPKNLSNLYELLSFPPYGVKEGIIPVILASVLLYYREEVGIYQDGTFIPVLGEEHFELLVKNPERYTVKYFAIEGLRGEIFKELENILSHGKKEKSNLRNTTLLSVVTPLYQFASKLPRYTQQTKTLDNTALNILKSLQQMVEPDELLFSALPLACGLSPIAFQSSPSEELTQSFKTSLIKGLREINQAYENLLTRCQFLLNSAFGIENQEDKLRANLRIRGYNLKDKCIEPSLKRFIKGIIDDSKSDRQWLEAVVMVVADKPAESWSDQDVTIFEVNLANIVRKFENLEAIQREVNTEGIEKGITARRISVTRDDGGETLKMIWIDKTRKDEVNQWVEKILTQLPPDQKLKEFVLAKLTEIILGSHFE